MNAMTKGATDVLTLRARVIKDVSGVDIAGLLGGLGRGTRVSGESAQAAKAAATRATAQSAPATAVVDTE
jgi:hypothetical protein